MGLDMYAYAGNPEAFENPKAEVELKTKKGQELSEIQYWRKHAYLHGWMHELFTQKGGKGEFNCQSVKLEREDLDRLQVAIKRETLPPTEGFFFGDYPPDEETKAEDLRFVAKARDALNAGQIVIYSSWW